MAQKGQSSRTMSSRNLPPSPPMVVLCAMLLLVSFVEWAGHPTLRVNAATPTHFSHRRLLEAIDKEQKSALKTPVKEHALIGKDLEKAQAGIDDEDDDEEAESETKENTEGEASEGSSDGSGAEDVTGKGDGSVGTATASADGEEDDDDENSSGDEEEEGDDDEDDGDIQEENLRFKDADVEAGESSEAIPAPIDVGLKVQPNISIAPDIQVIRGNISHPKIALLMSFPNSGTSFTLHMTREASNTTTATNYAGEGDIKDLPSTQAIEGPAGEQGPFLELIRGRYTNMPKHILTKTHCTGFCSNCGPYKLLFETPRSFMRGCLSGTRAVYGKRGLEIIDTIYSPKLVTKAIHIFRHPLDNTVARFHLEYNEEEDADNTKYVAKYPKNATGFQKWCARSDQKLDLFETRYLDEPLKAKLKKIPCFNEFFKYIQWHNNAFYTTHEMDLDVLYMHYHEYDENFEKARDKVLKFLGLPLVGLGVEFHSGKVYRHYYSREDKIAIKEFIMEYATRDTWKMVKDYDFEIDKSPVVASS